jgi:formylglycine-generating enzyme required for sulfatase activity
LEDYQDYERKVGGFENPEGTGARVLRGGSWVSNPDDVRCALRDDNFGPDLRIGIIGFRVVLAGVPAR